MAGEAEKADWTAHVQSHSRGRANHSDRLWNISPGQVYEYTRNRPSWPERPRRILVIEAAPDVYAGPVAYIDEHGKKHEVRRSSVAASYSYVGFIDDTVLAKAKS